MAAKMTVMIPAYISMMLVCCPLLAGGQKTYYVSILGRDNATIAQQPNSLLLFVNNRNDQPINVTITGSNCPDVGTRVVPVSNLNPETIKLDCPALIPTGIEIASKGLKVYSDSDFLLQVVQVDDSVPYGTTREGYLAIEAEHLGNEYHVITYCQTGGWCQFSVLATEDTSLNIRFPRDVTANASCLTSPGSTVVTGTSVPFYLNALDILHIESRQELSGTYISSDKHVAVTSGGRNIPAANNTAGPARESHFMEQLLPTNKWGKEFVVIPNELNIYGDLINIVTKNDNTTIEILGFSPFVIPVAGDWTIRRIDWGMDTYIKTDKPVAMAQFMFINLYNNEHQTELPSMVWVQAKNQRPDEHFFYADPNFFTSSPSVLVAASAPTGSGLQRKGIDPLRTPEAFFGSPQDEVKRSGAITYHDNLDGFSRLYDGNASAYGFIADNIAMMGNIKTQESEECVPMPGYPGDNIDNDCDDKVDEDVCTREDLETTYHIPYDSQDIAAPIFTKIVDIGIMDTIYFKVVTCGLLQIGLRSTIYSQSTSPTSKFAALQVSQSAILLESCSPNCNKDALVSVTGINDCTQDKIQFKLELKADEMKVTTIPAGVIGRVDITGLTVDRLLLMSLVRESNVTMDYSDKDCGKIISGTEDNYGTDFVIPYQEVDGGSVTDSHIFVTNKGSLEASLEIVDQNGMPLGSPYTVNVNDSITITVSETARGTNKFVRLRSTSEEISVQFMYETDDTHATAMMLLPTDILGSRYHYHFLDDTPPPDYRNLMVPVVENKAVKKRVDMTSLVEENKSNFEPLAYGTLVEAQMPFVLFNGYKRKAFAQMPPKEHLGKHFFIPAIDLNLINATATIYVITTEDSTYFKILGEYHQDDIKDYRGGVHHRELFQNETFEIQANKPVQVMLEIKGATWGSLLVIPHVDQYVDVTVFPKLNTTTFEVKHSSGVVLDAAGSTATARPNPIPTLPQGAAERHISLGGPAYFIVIVEIKPTTKYFVLTSDLKFSSASNTLCVLSAGTPGDGEDNDCDNLTDEESCTTSIILGEIDPDIDGIINDDCKADTVAYVNQAPLLDLASNTTVCPEPTNITAPNPTPPPATTQPPSPVIHNKLNADWYSNIVFPPARAPPAPPTFEPIESTATATVTTPAPSNTATTSATTGKPSTTAAPVETCTTDCVCPCGWVAQKNYTQEELKEVITEIQEKLKLSKNKLSSSLRKKTSAPDNRPSATAVGFAGFVFLIVTIGTMVLLDVSSIIRDLRLLRTNLQEVFNI